MRCKRTLVAIPKSLKTKNFTNNVMLAFVSLVLFSFTCIKGFVLFNGMCLDYCHIPVPTVILAWSRRSARMRPFCFLGFIQFLF